MECGHYGYWGIPAPFLLQPAGSAVIPPPTPPSVPAMQFVGSNPFALAQPSGARGIHTLQFFDSKLYVGFGDWIGNTGPIAVSYWNGSTWTNEFTAKTESIVRYRIFDGKLVIPYIDPKTGNHNDFAVLEPGGWTEYKVGPGPNEASVHVFDMFKASDGTYWACGSATDNGLAATWHTTDYASGSSWVRSAFPPGGSDDRVYSIWEVDGTVYCLFSAPYALYSWNGSAWVASGLSAADAPSWNHHAWDEAIVYTNSVNASPSKVFSFDASGVHAWDNAGNAYDVCASDGFVYALADNGTSYKQILRSTDLVTWTSLALTPTNAESLTVANGYAYVGTTDGSIYSIEI